jgi:hypothetical protein
MSFRVYTHVYDPTVRARRYTLALTESSQRAERLVETFNRNERARCASQKAQRKGGPVTRVASYEVAP